MSLSDQTSKQFKSRVLEGLSISFKILSLFGIGSFVLFLYMTQRYMSHFQLELLKIDTIQSSCFVRQVGSMFTVEEFKIAGSSALAIIMILHFLERISNSFFEKKKLTFTNRSLKLKIFLLLFGTISYFLQACFFNHLSLSSLLLPCPDLLSSYQYSRDQVPELRDLAAITTNFGFIEVTYSVPSTNQATVLSSNGKFAYIASSSAISALNIEGLSFVELATLSLKCGALALSNDNKYLFAGCGNLIYTIDVQTSTSLQIIGSYDTAESLKKLLMLPSTSTLVAVGQTHLRLLDASNPSSLSLQSFALATGGRVSSSSDSTLLALSKGWNGVSLYDISNKAAITLLSQISAPNAQGATFSSDKNLLYVANTDSDSSGNPANFFEAYSISNRASPSKLSSLSGYSCNDIVLDDNNSVAFVGLEDGVVKLDISNSASLSMISKITTGTSTISILKNPSNTTQYYLNTNYYLFRLAIPTLGTNVYGTWTRVGSYAISARLFQIQTTKDNQRAYVASIDETLIVYDISDPTNIRQTHKRGTYTETRKLALSKDEKYLYGGSEKNRLYVWDLANRDSPDLKFSRGTANIITDLDIATDRKILCVAMDVSLELYDISNPISPVSVYFSKIYKGSCKFSQDETLLYTTSESNGLAVLNIEDLRTVRQVGSVESMSNMYAYDYERKLGFCCARGGVSILDLTFPASPVLLSVVPNYECRRIILSNTNRYIAYAADYVGGVKIINYANPKYPLIISALTSTAPVESVGITQDDQYLFYASYNEFAAYQYSINYGMIINSEAYIGKPTTQFPSYMAKTSGVFQLNLAPFKISKLLRLNYNPYGIASYQAVPSWLTFNEDTNLVGYNPIFPEQLGGYLITWYISQKISTNSFVGMGSISTTSDSESLYLFLAQMGYLDQEGYITSNFDEDVQIQLSTTFSSSESAIRNYLKSNIIKTVTGISVVPSLAIITSPQISISTTSTRRVLCVMELITEGAVFCRFNYIAAVQFFSGDTKVSISGSADDVQRTLAQLRMFASIDSQKAAIVSVDDDLNPQIVLTIPNFSDILTKNQAPIVQKEFPRYTTTGGSHMTFPIDDSYVLDPDGDTVSYLIEDPKGGNGWIRISENAISGTAPDGYYTAEVNLVATDGYLKTRIPIRIHVDPTPLWYLSTAASVLGTLFSILGLYAYYSQLMNILTKNKYRIPHTILLKPKQNLDTDVIFPFTFLGNYDNQYEEIKEALELKLKIENEKKEFEETKKSKKRCQMKKKAIILKTDFENLKELEQAILDEFAKVPADEEKESLGKSDDQRRAETNILFMFKSEYILKFLGKHKPSMKIFKACKKSWANFIKVSNKMSEILPEVEWDDPTFKRTIYQTKSTKKYYEKLKPLKMNELDDGPATDGIYWGLIKKALIFHAQKNFCIDDDIFSILIRSLEQVERSFFKFLGKKDEVLPSLGNELGYGIEYIISGNKVGFRGTVDSNISNRLLKIQFLRTDGRIVKEMKIKGAKQ